MKISIVTFYVVLLLFLGASCDNKAGNKAEMPVRYSDTITAPPKPVDVVPVEEEKVVEETTTSGDEADEEVAGEMPPPVANANPVTKPRSRGPASSDNPIVEETTDNNVEVGEETTPTPPTTPTPGNSNDKEKGLIAVDVPDDMKQGKASFVKVYLLKDTSVAKLTERLTEEVKDNLIIDSLLLTSIAKVTLSDPSDGKHFHIPPQDNLEQVVDADGSSMWQFSVTPLTAGSHPIVVTVSIVVSRGDKELEKTVQTYNRSIMIKADYVYTAKKFINEHWDWFAGAILLPIIAFFRKKIVALWRRFINKFKKSEQ